MPRTAKPSLHDNDALLTYRVGPVLCCGPTLPIVTITPPPAKLTRIPGTSTAEPGIFKHGPDIISATDLRYRFGVKPENWKQPGQVIIAKHADLTRGYFVDEIIDVTHFPETGWGQLPAYLPRGVFSRTLVIDKKIYLYAEFEKLSQLQGSGYLSDYIAHLEGLREKETKTVTNKAKPRNSLNKKEENTNSEITQPKIKPATSSHAKAQDTSTENFPEKKYPEDKLTATENKTSVTKPENKLPLTTEVEPKIITKKQNSKNTASHSKIKIAENFVLHPLEKQNSKKYTIPNEKTNGEENEKTKADITQPLQSSPLKHQSNAETKKTHKITEGIVENKNTSTDNKANYSTKIKTVSSGNKKSSLVDGTNTINMHTQSNELEHEDPEQDSNAFSLLFILIILALISAAGYYYFSTPETLNDSENNTNKNINKYSDDISNTLPVEKDITHKVTTLPEKPKHQDTTQPTLPTQIISAPLQAAIPSITPEVPDNSNQQKSQPAITAKEPNEYHASINQEHTTITIELKGPLPPKVTNASPSIVNKEESSTVENETLNQSISPDANNKNIPDISKGDKTTKPQKKTAKDNAIEIIHIIVKGDTLWAIAKHYLQNPFLYPELAKLSRIKNPDLIYPGNRVRIIYRAQN